MQSKILRLQDKTAALNKNFEFLIEFMTVSALSDKANYHRIGKSAEWEDSKAEYFQKACCKSERKTQLSVHISRMK